MADQNARQDENQVPALILHTGTAGTAETIRAIADSSGNLMVNLAAGEEINIGTLVVGTVSQMPYAILVDGTTTTNVTYLGLGTPGSNASSAVWQIKKIDETTANVAIINFADGDSNFDNVWDDRGTATYS